MAVVAKTEARDYEALGGLSCDAFDVILERWNVCQLGRQSSRLSNVIDVR